MTVALRPCIFCSASTWPGQRVCPACREAKRRQLAKVFAKAARAWRPPARKRARRGR